MAGDENQMQKKTPLVRDLTPPPSTGSILEVEALPKKRTILESLRNFELSLDYKLGGRGFVETIGVDRIREEDKQPPSIWNAFLIWPSFMVHAGTVPIGLLGPEFGLTLQQSACATVIGVMVGACCPAFTGSLGPELGLRQIAISRYSFGFWGAKLCSLLNIIVSIGFAVVNAVAVGQILSAVSDFSMSSAVGCVIVAIVAYALSFFGYKIINLYLKYSWVMAMALFIVLYVKSADHTGPIPDGQALTGITLFGTALSFASICFSTVAGWCTYPADYYCNFPATTPKWKTATLTWLGLTISSTFTLMLGVVLGNATITAGHEPFLTEYKAHNFGGLLLAAFGYGAAAKFALVLCVFTVIGGNIATNYSAALSIQLWGSFARAVPRFLWSLLVAVIIAVLSIAGREKLSPIINNFVSLMAYWAISFTVILALEDRLFRRKSRYDLEVWNTPHKLPVGIAGVATLIATYCAGGVTGMNQTWYVGPIARMIGDYGGDVGVFLCAGITALVYPALRALELHHFRR